jgi:hypothetical protein
MDNTIKDTERLTRKQKKADNYKWYRDKMDSLDMSLSDQRYSYGDISEEKRLRINYDLFNNIIDTSDFEYVCKPYGAKVGELPTKMTNKDISSGKIKAILGMESKRSLNFRVFATNPEASSRKEKKQIELIREFVVNQIMGPIREKEQIAAAEKMKGQKISEEEAEKIRMQVAEEIKAKTPEEVKKYMERDHKDVVEIMTHQLLEYLIQNTDAKRKFNKGMKHACLSAKEVYYVGDIGGEANFWNVNSRRFTCDNSPDVDFIQDKEWAVAEYPMTPAMLISFFGDELDDDEIDIIYNSWGGFHKEDFYEEDLFAMFDRYHQDDDARHIKAVHGTWKGLRKIGFLDYKGKDGKVKTKMVDETYKTNPDYGDIAIEWKWIPVSYECWKIRTSEPIYLRCREIPGQLKDINTIHKCKLPYYGVYYDDMNSAPTAPMDRLKPFQYFFNILNYRFELLASTDKGKKILMNIKSIPQSEGIDLKKWKYIMESSPMMWWNPDETGMEGYADANTIAKVLDLSYAGDMQKYIEMMEYVRQQAGRALGITDQVEGEIGQREAVRNVQQGLNQSSNILEPYFELHDYVKRDVLMALVETAKICYQGEKTVKLSYAIDDMSSRTLTLDVGLLNNSTLGMFIQNSSKAQEAKELIKQLTHAAVQNQKAELSDVASIIRQDSIVEAEEDLRKAERVRDDKAKEIEEMKNKAAAEADKRAEDKAVKDHEREKELIVLKEEERRKTALVQGAMTGASFNPDTDNDNDGKNDYIEIAEAEMERDFKIKAHNLEERKFAHQKRVDEESLKQNKQKQKQ